MPDDAVKTINLSVPSTPIQEHPQNVTVVPRRKKRRDGDQKDEEDQRQNGSSEGGHPLAKIEDKVTITWPEGRGEGPQGNGEERRARHADQSGCEDKDMKRIDIKV